MAEDAPKTYPIPPSDVLALTDPAIQKVYANGFTLGLTNADVQLVLKLFGRPIIVLNISYTLAKTLAQQLTSLVGQWEIKTGQKLQTTESIDKVFAPQSHAVENKPQ